MKLNPLEASVFGSSMRFIKATELELIEGEGVVAVAPGRFGSLVMGDSLGSTGSRLSQGIGGVGGVGCVISPHGGTSRPLRWRWEGTIACRMLPLIWRRSSNE